MLFHEIYGKYYETVAQILRYASQNGSISRREIRRIVSGSAFSESTMYIPEAVKDSWYLLNEAGESVLQDPPDRPLTTVEKRWMKAVLQDPRVRLFDLPDSGLENVEPLFTRDMFCWFDRYEDGDPFEDPRYIQNFRTLAEAIREGRKVRVCHRGANAEKVYVCIPYRLEYSEKDDKFRLLAVENGHPLILNVARIHSCELLEAASFRGEIPKVHKGKLVLELQNRRNALERAMLHFSHLEKETEQLEKGAYRITLRYEPRDEQELLIRILSFGPMLKVVEPESLVEQIRNRIEKQQNLRTL